VYLSVVSEAGQGHSRRGGRTGGRPAAARTLTRRARSAKVPRGMRTVFDQLAKRLLVQAFQQAGEVRTQVEVSAETQAIDAWVQPAPDAAERRRALGLLGRLAERTCLVEPFHEPPTPPQLRDCVLKQLAYDARERRTARAEGREAAPLVPLWLLSAGVPRTAVAEFEFRPLAGWPAGVYGVAAGWEVRLVVISELARSRETLLLRLMGAGAVLAAAVADLAALPPDALEVRVALPVLVALRLTLPPAEDQTGEERQVAMDVQKIYDEVVRRAADDGATRTLVRLIGLKLGRALTEVEQREVTTRVVQRGHEAIERAFVQLDAPALERWLTLPLSGPG
jgi:hypothetical protein